jgi:opacity protein-like surface antigen
MGADASSALFPDGLQNLSDNPLTIDSLDQFTPEPNFFTPMGSGLEAAIRNLDIQSAMSFYSNKVIVLLSDGKHNCGTNPLDVPIPEGVKVYTIGLGEDDIEPETIEDIATSTGAAYSSTSSPREMEELFIQIATETSWKLQDVPVVDSKSSISQDKVAFVVVWDNPEDSLSFELDLPGNGPNLTPNNLDSFSPMKCTYYPPASHTTHAFYVCEGIPQELLGEWRFTNISNRGVLVNPGDVLLKVIEDPRVIAAFDIEKINHYVGQPMVLSARLTEDGKPLTGVQQVYADLVRSPAFPLGTLLAENSPSADHPSALPPNSDRTPRRHYIDGIMKELKIDSLSKPDGFRVELKDDGLGIDRRAGDGIYTGVFTGTEYEGSYTFKFRARGKNRDGVTFDRTQTLSKYVKFAASTDSTRVEVVSVESSQESEYLFATIRVTPRDVFGAYMGPFRGDRIRVWSNSGRFDGGYVDRKDGSYDFTLSYEKGTEPQISVSTGDLIVADRMEVPSQALSPCSFSLHAGLSIPRGSFKNIYDCDYSLGLSLDYHFTPQFSMVCLLGYNHFNSKTFSTRDTYWWNISANLKYEFGSRLIKPYINGGFGVYIPEHRSTKLGFNLGLGLHYSITPDWLIEFGADYHNVFTRGSRTRFLVPYIGLVYRF